MRKDSEKRARLHRIKGNQLLFVCFFFLSEDDISDIFTRRVHRGVIELNVWGLLRDRDGR